MIAAPPSRFRMPGVLRIVGATSARRQATVIACLFLAGLAEGVGLASLLPVLSAATGESAEHASPLGQTVTATLDWLGLPPDLGVLLTLVVGGLLLKAALTLLAMNHVGYAVAEVSTGLRMTLIDRLLGVRWGYFTRQPVGRFANAMSQEATRAGEAYLAAVMVVTLLMQSAIYVVLALLISWKLAVIAVLLGVGMAAALSWSVRLARKAGRRQTRRTHDLVTQLSDALAGMKPLKAMARERELTGVLSGKVKDLNRALRTQVFARQARRNFEEPLLAIAFAVGFYAATTIWAVPASQLIIMGLLLARAATVMSKVQQQWQAAAICESAYWSLRRMIDEAGAEQEPPSGRLRPDLERAATFDRVSFRFGTKPVLRDVSLEIPAGRITVITGGSGAGKTTIADLLLGLYRADAGRIAIDGQPIESIDLAAWRGMIGYVPQELFLFHDTVLGNVTLGDPRLDRDAAREALQAAGAWDFVSSLPTGMDSSVGERGALLSGGQRQRIAIARALVHRPKLLILDEATSALDPATEAAICENIRRLAGDLTILVITHQPAWVNVADRIYRLENQAVRRVEAGQRAHAL